MHFYIDTKTSYSETFEISKISFAENYQLGQKIGSGAFGYVVFATNKHDDNKYAVKFIRVDDRNSGARERNYLCMLKHVNIVKFFGYSIVTDSFTGRVFFEKFSK